MSVGGIKALLLVMGAGLLFFLIDVWVDTTPPPENKEYIKELSENKPITYNKHPGFRSAADEYSRPAFNTKNDKSASNVDDSVPDSYKRSTDSSAGSKNPSPQDLTASNASAGSKLPPLPPGLTLNDIPEEYSDNVNAFAERLEYIKNNPATDEQQNELAEPIYFSSLTPDLSNGVPYFTTAFSPYCYRIYATFANNTPNFHDKTAVLVKWHNSEQIVLGYEYYRIAPDSNYNFVWREMPYWDAGIHNVEIYELENDVRLLASGSFLVEDLAEYVAYPALYSTPQQLSASTVYYKNDDIYLRLAYSSLTGAYLNMTVYKMESQETVFDQQIMLSAAKNDTLISYLKRASDVFPFGTYHLDLTDENNTLVGRATFYINEE